MSADDFIKGEYLDFVDSLEARAEVECNGFLYSAKGRVAYAEGKVDQYDLFRKPWHHVARYASEELIEFFRTNRRLTYSEFRDQLRGQWAA